MILRAVSWSTSGRVANWSCEAAFTLIFLDESWFQPSRAPSATASGFYPGRPAASLDIAGVPVRTRPARPPPGVASGGDRLGSGQIRLLTSMGVNRRAEALSSGKEVWERAV